MPRSLDTASGRRLELPVVNPDDIVLSDIVVGLSRICRFNAQTSAFYSVAQHAVLVASLVEETYERLDLAFKALHHDSHEAYIGDMPRPVKDYLARVNPPTEYLWKNLEKALDSAIDRAFGLPPVTDRDDNALIKRADNCALLMEAALLLSDGGEGLRRDLEADEDTDLDALAQPYPCPTPLSPEAASEAFVAVHERLALERR